MIDAHEIGIQLAMQDGVSAGLQVIMQGLGTLDRAVAATAGRLDALPEVTQRAGQATAAAASVQVPMVVGPAASAAEPAAAGALVAARVLAPELAVTAREETFAPPEAAPVVLRTMTPPLPAAPVAAITATMAAPLGGTPRVAAPEIAAPLATPAAAVVAMALAKSGVVGPASAPARAAAPIVPQVVPQSVADPVPAAPGRAPMVEPARWAATVVPVAPIMPAAVEPMQVAAPLARAALVMQTPRMAPIAPMMPSLPIDVVEPIRTMERGMRQTPTAPLPRVSALPAAAQAPAAPIAGRPGGQAAMPGRELLPGRPAVPPAQAQEGGKSGGDVMLDGRLVGHWLADRMGRDAARPPAGTTHFDPRQSAACTPSGSL